MGILCLKHWLIFPLLNKRDRHFLCRRQLGLAGSWMNGMQWTNGYLLLNSLPGNWLQVWPDGPNLFLPHKDIYFSLPLTSFAMETVPRAGRRQGPTLCFLHLVREANSYTHETKERVRKYMRCAVRKVVPLKFPRILKWGEKMSQGLSDCLHKL